MNRDVLINKTKAGKPRNKHLSKWKKEKKDSVCPLRTLADGHAACPIRGGVIKCILVTGCWVNWLWQLIDMSGSLYITLQSHNPLSKESKLCRSISLRWTGWPTLNGVYPCCISPCVHSLSPSPCVAILVIANASRKPQKGTHHLHVRQILGPINSLRAECTASDLEPPTWSDRWQKRAHTLEHTRLNLLKNKQVNSKALAHYSCYCYYFLHLS